MALISPGNLGSLHGASEKQIKGLQHRVSPVYEDGGNGGRKPIIPDLALFNSRPTGDLVSDALPTISQCAIHLEMLEVFHTLRQEVIQSHDLDVVFGISPNLRTVYRKQWNGTKCVALPTALKDDTFEDRRRKKWPYFLSIAVTRFHGWMQMVEKHLKKGEDGLDLPKHLFLPPLDILVVWHAFLLNCDDFKEYCAAQKLEHVQDIVFPWTEIHAAIDSHTWTYTLPTEHTDWLRNIESITTNLVKALAVVGKSTGPTWHLLTTFTSNNPTYTHIKIDDSNAFARTIKAARYSQGHNESIVENVQRQCVFVDKMHANRWIRSPAVEGTLRRAVDRYDKFLHLFRLYPHNFLVPTLDVDLVWHTHQCNAEEYRRFVTERVGRFINHEDKIGRDTLDSGFVNADGWYRLHFGEQYQVCLCWSCEAIQSAVEKLDEEALNNVDPYVEQLAEAVESEVDFYRQAEVGRRVVAPNCSASTMPSKRSPG